ncbi:MAG: hypothetical protein IJR89_04010 [Clostridia bacterium]|nr:hypothetical protein [Clostridia bacterium]
MKKKILAVVLSLAMILPLVPAMVIPTFADGGNVAKIGDVEYESLAAAIAAVQDGETITLLDDIELSSTVRLDKVGTYTINGGSGSGRKTISMAANADFGSDGAFCFGISGDKSDIANKNYRLEYVQFTGFNSEIVRAESCTLTLSDCWFSNNTITEFSGRAKDLLCVAAADVTVDKCSINSNTTGAPVGEYPSTVIYADQGSKLTISDSNFMHNTSAGNAIVQLAECASVAEGLPYNITDCIFIENTVSGNGNVAVVYASYPTDFESNYFYGNQVTTSANAKDAVIVLGSNATGSVINLNGFVYNTLSSDGSKRATVYTGANCDLSNNFWGDSGISESSTGGTGRYFINGAEADVGIGLDYLVTGTPTVTNTNYAVSCYHNNGMSCSLTLYEAPAVYVAQIGDAEYESLADAIAAVPTDGTKTTIKMIADETLAANATLTVAATKNIVLDLNGFTVTGSADTNAFYFITNEGTLEITDTSAGANGKITASTSNPDTGYSKENVTIYNCGGTLTLTAGKVENTTAGYRLSYAINNSSNAWGSSVISTFNMTGGTVSAPQGDAALRVYQNTGVNWKVYSKNYVNISGGTILDSGIFVDTVLYTKDQDLTDLTADDITKSCVIDTEINISGGTINGLIDMKIRHPFSTKLNITGGDFTNTKFRVRKWASEYGKDASAGTLAEPTEPMVKISGGRFGFVNAASMFNISTAWTDTSSWTTYDTPFEVTGGKFNLNPTYVAEGYEAVANTDDDSATYGYKIGESNYAAYIGNVKYETLAAAIDAAQDGDVVTLLKDLSVDSVVFIPKSITLNGANHTLTTTASRAIRINQSNVTVTIQNLTIAGNTERAVQVDSDKDSVRLTLDHVTAAATYYTVNICGSVDDLELNVTNCTLTGWGVINLWGDNGTVSVSNSTLIGINDKSYNAEGWNDFGVIIMEGDTTGQTTEHSVDYNVTVTNCNITANSTTGNRQFVVLHNNPSANNNLALDGCTITLGNENCHFYLDQSVQSATKIRATYMEGTLDVPTLPDGYLYVPVADNYKLIAQAVAVIGETPYASLKDAVEAATAGDTIELIADDDVSLTSGGEIVINKSLTINGNDHTIYGTPDQTGSNDIFITGNGTVTINGLNVEGFGYNHATDAGHAPIYVSSNFTGTVNLIGVSVSKFNRGGIFLYGGNFNVEGCDIDCANSRSGAFTKGIEIKGSASGTISDTDIYNMERSSTTYSTAGIEIYGNGSIVVDNCTISSNVGNHTTTKGTYGIVSSRVGAHDPSGGSLQVKDTVIDVTNAALSVTDSDDYGPVNNYSIEVTGCTFSNYIATWSATSTVTINSGDFAEDVYADAGTIIIHGGKFINFAPDTDTGSIVIDGGKFSADPSTYVASGYTAAAISEDSYFFEVVPASAVVARIGDTQYTTLAAAFAAAQDGDTITLLDNYDMEANEPGYGYTTSYVAQDETVNRNNMIVISGNNITFDLDGYTLSNLFNNTFKVTGTNVTFQNGAMTLGQLYYGEYSNGAVTKLYETPTYGSYIVYVREATNFVVNNLTTFGGINVSASTATINNLSFSGLKFYAVCSQSGSVVTINNGTYNKAVPGAANYLFWVENGSVMNITGGTFIKGSATFHTGIKPVITGGIFDFDPTNKGVAEGYEAVALSGDNLGKWQVGEVKAGNLVEETEPENITEGFDATYTVTKTVVDANDEVIEGSTGTAREVNVRVEVENAIPENKEIASGNTADEILDNLNMEKVLDSVVDAVADADDTLNVHIQVVRDTPPIVENTITYEVHPIALIYVNDATTPTETVTITNDKLESGAVFTVTLPVPNELAAAAASNGLIKVVHRSADYPAETKHFPLQGTYDHYYVQFTVTHFSEFELAIDTFAGNPGYAWGASLILKDMVAINLKVWDLKDRYGNAETDPSRFTVKYTFHDETKEVALTGAENNITVAKVVAKELVDEVTLELYYDGVLLESRNYSARRYCMNKTDTTKSDYEVNLDTLCRALLEYGAAAQNRFNYKTDDLANKNLTEHAALSDVPEYSHTKDGDLTLSASLSLKENTQINVYFLPAAGYTSGDYTATVGGQPVTITASGSYGYIAVPGIAAKNLGDNVTVVITRTGTEETTELTYSPMTWAYHKQGTETTEVEYYVARTLYAYYLAAAAYFAN